MKILSELEPNSKIEVIHISGNLTDSSDVIKLKEWLYTCMYENRCLQLIDFRHVSSIDKEGIKVLHDLVRRGMQIRLFNVSPEIKLIMWAKRKQRSLIGNVYHENNRTKAVLMFEKELSGISEQEKPTTKIGVKRRQYIRANSSFPLKFKCLFSGNEIILCKAMAQNISIGGMFADKVIAINKPIEKLIKRHSLVGKELYSLRFELSSIALCIETQGECMREYCKQCNLSLGIRFDDLTQYQEELLMGAVYDNSI